ncbi:hypothetical protein Q4I32_007048 [Leishmania shawi]|uniref:Uncharacterized protein n=1 Tax=Leishmania shawi TaxID=5680 RepID=A0AAW3BDA1_9TRYP
MIHPSDSAADASNKANKNNYLVNGFSDTALHPVVFYVPLYSANAYSFIIEQLTRASHISALVLLDPMLFSTSTAPSTPPSPSASSETQGQQHVALSVPPSITTTVEASPSNPLAAPPPPLSLKRECRPLYGRLIRSRLLQ